MTHYACLVIGDNPERELAPFQEADGRNSEYCQFIEDNTYAIDDTVHKKGYWSNPNGKWDWYYLGGRWDGFLLTKAGHNENQVTKDEIDFATMRANLFTSAAKDYNQILKIFNNQIPIVDYSWGDLSHIKNILQRRQTYEYQPGKLLWDTKYATLPCKTRELLDRYDIEQFKSHSSVESFALTESLKAGVTMAVIHNGVYYERGTTLWWGNVDEKMTHEQWNEWYHKYISELPDDTLLSVYDLHT